MKKKTTDSLTHELMSEANIESYIQKNQSYFAESNLAALLTAHYKKSGCSKADLARKSCISEVYLHQVFSGRRKPSRDRLLCLCVGLGATLDETQRLLLQAAYAQLYPKNKRDAIICHGIVHHTPINDINDTLFAENEKTFF